MNDTQQDLSQAGLSPQAMQWQESPLPTLSDTAATAYQSQADRLDVSVSHAGQTSDRSQVMPDDVYAKYLKWKNEPLQEQALISIVIPAYNEAERIVPTIGAIASYMTTLDVPWELLVADDGSTDETVALLQELDLANLHVLVAEKNGGKGSAVRRGMQAASGEYILFADADNSTPIEQLGGMLTLMDDQKFDVLVGSRAANGAQEANRSFLRQTMSDTLRWIVQHIMHIGVQDTQCGFKLFRHDAAEELSRRQTIDGFSFDLELLYLTNKLGYKLGEVPVEWFDAPGSKVDSLKEARRFIQDIVRIKMNDARGMYGEA